MRSWPLPVPFKFFLGVTALGIFACEHVSPQRGAHDSSLGQQATGAFRPSGTSPETVCARRRRLVAMEPALPGAPGLESARAEIVARAKAEPVLFLEAPSAGAVSRQVGALRERLYRETAPWRTYSEAFKRFGHHPRELRQVFLTDGYLYAEQPAVAAILASAIALNQLFTERKVVVTRGNHTLHAARKNGNYYWTDGPELGAPAKLWLFDRVAAEGEPLGPPKLVALGDVRAKTGADSIEIERLTADGVLAQLDYAQERVPALLAIHRGELVFDCQAPERDAIAKMQAAQALSLRRAKVLARLRASIDEQIAEALPFDEPKTEEGQQDGKLRQEWRLAYLRGAWSYEFNGDRYPVFGANGRPKTPQVCVDFIVDSWERMADTRWLGRDEGRGRKLGRINFDTLDIDNRRSVDRLIDFARARPEWFDVLEFAESERVRFLERRRFFRRLYERRADFRPGDVVAIYGLRDDEKPHYHSFFIVADDPITRMPTLLAANAGRPRIRSWEGEMQNAPRRSILARIRPRLDWLESLAALNQSSPVALLTRTSLERF